MSDILKEIADSFSNVQKYNYIYTLGDRKRKVIVSILSSSADDFTHIFGLDHLKDIDTINRSTHSTRQKIAVFNNILKGNIKFSDIEKSKYLNKPIPGTLNSKTNYPYTIMERINIMSNIEKILDNSYKGKFYKWDKSKCKVRNTSINGDYLLKIPSKEHPNENYYIFLYQTNTINSKSDDIKLNVFSAFLDSVDLSSGQQHHYTVLKEVKRDKQTKQEYIIYIHNSLLQEQNQITNKPRLPFSLTEQVKKKPLEPQKFHKLKGKDGPNL